MGILSDLFGIKTEEHIVTKKPKETLSIPNSEIEEIYGMIDEVGRGSLRAKVVIMKKLCSLYPNKIKLTTHLSIDTSEFWKPKINLW